MQIILSVIAIIWGPRRKLSDFLCLIELSEIFGIALDTVDLPNQGRTEKFACKAGGEQEAKHEHEVKQTSEIAQVG